LTIHYDGINKTFTIEALNDWFGSVGMRIFCDDDLEFNHDENPYQDIQVTVQNLNDDPPVWDPLPDLEIPEDTNIDNWLDLDTKVTDIDSNPAEIKLSIEKNTNGTSLGVTIDPEHYLDIKTLEKDFDKETTVTLKATDESGNSANTSFTIKVIPRNDPPTTTLDYPGNGSTIVSSTIELRWNASDPETPTKELSYNVFLGTGGGFEQAATGIDDLTFTAESLSDGATYTWWVIPNDGILDGICASGRYTFTVNKSIGSTSTLISPLSGEVFNEESVTLEWTGKTQAGLSISYDVLLDEGEVEPTTLVAEDITTTSLVLGDLEDGTTYSWTVIPRDIRGWGICTSGFWNFTIDSSLLLFGVEVTADQTEIEVMQGEYVNLTVEISNVGENLDIIVPELDARLLTTTITLESEGTELNFGPLEKRSLTLDILIPDNTPAITYTLTITATSMGDGSSDSVDITVEVVPMGTGSSDQDSRFSDSSLWLIILVIILVIVLILVMFYRQRKWIKEEEERRLEEDRKRKEEAMRLARAIKAMRGTVVRPSGIAAGIPAVGPDGRPVAQIAKPPEADVLQLPKASVIPPPDTSAPPLSGAPSPPPGAPPSTIPGAPPPATPGMPPGTAAPPSPSTAVSSTPPPGSPTPEGPTTSPGPTAPTTSSSETTPAPSAGEAQPKDGAQGGQDQGSQDGVKYKLPGDR